MIVSFVCHICMYETKYNLSFRGTRRSWQDLQDHMKSAHNITDPKLYKFHRRDQISKVSRASTNNSGGITTGERKSDHSKWNRWALMNPIEPHHSVNETEPIIETLITIDLFLIVFFPIMIAFELFSEGIVYHSYCPVRVICFNYFMRFTPLLIVEIAGELFCITIYLAYRNRSKSINTRSETPVENTQ